MVNSHLHNWRASNANDVITISAKSLVGPKRERECNKEYVLLNAYHGSCVKQVPFSVLL